MRGSRERRRRQLWVREDRKTQSLFKMRGAERATIPKGGTVTKAVESPKSVGMSARRLERVRPAMQAYVDRGVYAGVDTLIARRGKVVHWEQFGWRDKEAQTPMSADAIFRLYSMTKPIVCTGLMTLLEEARLTLFDPVAKYVPAFGRMKVLEADGSLVNPARPILLRDLMTHTSGLTYHFVDESPVGKMYQRSKLLDAKCSLEAAIDDLTQFPLAFQPRSRWRYSVGIDVIARVIEVVSSRPLGAFLRERLFEPLGMVDTAFEVPLEKRNRLAAMYGRPDVIAPGPTVSSEFEAWAKGVNDRLDVKSLSSATPFRVQYRPLGA
jgi:CubicO group peptidase (beta-lactamase class C family)